MNSPYEPRECATLNTFACGKCRENGTLQTSKYIVGEPRVVVERLTPNVMNSWDKCLLILPNCKQLQANNVMAASSPLNYKIKWRLLTIERHFGGVMVSCICIGAKCVFWRSDGKFKCLGAKVCFLVSTRLTSECLLALKVALK